MKKVMFIFMGIVIGIIGTSYAAYKLMASQVSFDKTNTNLSSENVQDSIDEIADLIKYGDATEGDIASGKTALVNGKKITGSMTINDTNKFESMTISIPASSKATSWTKTVTLPKEGLEIGKNCFVVCNDYGSVDSDVKLTYSISGTTLTISATMSDRAFYWCEFTVYYIA
mgnify:CR=1 FL=1